GVGAMIIVVVVLAVERGLVLVLFLEVLVLLGPMLLRVPVLLVGVAIEAALGHGALHLLQLLDDRVRLLGDSGTAVDRGVVDRLALDALGLGGLGLVLLAA